MSILELEIYRFLQEMETAVTNTNHRCIVYVHVCDISQSVAQKRSSPVVEFLARRRNKNENNSLLVIKLRASENKTFSSLT